MSVVKNETLKLVANWCNAASVTLGGAGVVVPILSKYYNLGPQLQDPEGTWSLVVLCGTLAIALHLIGQLFWEGLMSSRDILPYAAPIIFAAGVALTSWLSYLRIMRKYPPASVKQSQKYPPTPLDRSKKPAQT